MLSVCDWEKEAWSTDIFEFRKIVLFNIYFFRFAVNFTGTFAEIDVQKVDHQ